MVISLFKLSCEKKKTFAVFGRLNDFMRSIQRGRNTRRLTLVAKESGRVGLLGSAV